MRFLVPIALAFMLLAGWVRVGISAEITGTILTLDYGAPARIPNAKVKFHEVGGSTFTIVTSETGEYATPLVPGSYRMTVTANGFCPVHRPFFRATSDSPVRFDFTLTTICPRDRISVGASDAYFDSSIPYYFEENIPLSVNGESNLIIGFGRRKRTDQFLTYYPIPVPDHAGVEIPVTISFGTYTIQAHQAFLDEKVKILQVEQNVSITDGSSSQARRVSCAIIRLNDPEPKVHSCPF